MCGVLGCFSKSGSEISKKYFQEINSGLDMLHHRGPDNKSIISSSNNSLLLGHRRLAIIDLTPDSNQPFTKNKNKYLSFNGEIYNYKEIASQFFSKERLRTNSDTEILYEILLKDPELIRYLEGMYAGCFYDGESIHLFRDPLGIKPIYYYEDNELVFFSSSLKVIKELNIASSLSISEVAKCSFILNGHLDQGMTPYNEVHEVKPGSIMSFSPNGKKYSRIIEESYLIFDTTKDNSLSFTEIIDNTVKKHLVSDVPIALMYSAGLDSNLLAKSVSRFSDVNAFSLGFESFKDSPNDEIPLASNIANEEGYKLSYRYLSNNEVLDNTDQYLENLDTLSIDGFNTWMVSKFISEKGFKVAISGAGGDEIFIGYANFVYLKWMKKFIDLIPKFPRYLISKLVPKNDLKNRKISSAINANSLKDLYFIKRSLFDLKLLSNYFDEENIDIIYSKFLKHKTDSIQLLSKENNINVSNLEYHFYCRNQLVKDADWASMSHSLELRIPLVDKVFFKQAVAFRNQNSLRNKFKYYSLYNPTLNSNLFDRSKTGFSVPLLNLIGGSNDYVTNYRALLDEVFFKVTGEKI